MHQPALSPARPSGPGGLMRSGSQPSSLDSLPCRLMKPSRSVRPSSPLPLGGSSNVCTLPRSSRCVSTPVHEIKAQCRRRTFHGRHPRKAHSAHCTCSPEQRGTSPQIPDRPSQSGPPQPGSHGPARHQVTSKVINDGGADHPGRARLAKWASPTRLSVQL